MSGGLDPRSAGPLAANPPDGGVVAVLANGEVPRGAALELLRSADALVACDGALATARALGREPDFVVGDGDSASPEDLVALGVRFVRDGSADTNDLDKAFRFARTRWPRAFSIVILGAGGGREDHLVGNVFRLPAFAAACPGVAMATNAGRFDVVDGTRTFACRPGAAVSVFAPEPGTRMESEGLVWPLKGVDLGPLWSGTLNRAEGTSFTVRATRPALVYRAW